MERQLRVLFIEDQLADIELALGQLEHDGIGVDWRAADSEIEVRNTLEEFRPDVVLCDFTIPGYSGAQRSISFMRCIQIFPLSTCLERLLLVSTRPQRRRASPHSTKERSLA
jgi:hypothetical protein